LHEKHLCAEQFQIRLMSIKRQTILQSVHRQLILGGLIRGKRKPFGIYFIGWFEAAPSLKVMCRTFVIGSRIVFPANAVF
jgi:hypothetical protein